MRKEIDDDDVLTWIFSLIEERVAFDFFSHYVDVKLISVYLFVKNLIFNRDHLFNDLVNSKKNTLEITLKNLSLFITYYSLRDFI